MLANDVNWYNSTMAGAPQIGEEPGDLINLLQAVLIDGFNLISLSSLVFDSATGDIVGETAEPHGFLQYQRIRIDGADQPEFNGDFVVDSHTDTQFRVRPGEQGSPTTATATTTSSITALTPGLGTWERAFEDPSGNKVAYRCTADEAPDLLWRFDDSHEQSEANYGNAVQTIFGAAYTMNSIDDYDGWITSNSWVIRKLDTRYPKNDNGTATWSIVADRQIVYLTVAFGGRYSYSVATYAFGYINSFRAADAYHGIIIAGESGESSNYAASHFARFSVTSYMSLARSYDQRPNTVAPRMVGSATSNYFGYDGIPYPNPVDNGYYLFGPILVCEGDNDGPLRGTMPGLLQPLNRMRGRPAAGSPYLSPEGRLYYVQPTGTNGHSDDCQIAFDLDEPWR